MEPFPEMAGQPTRGSYGPRIKAGEAEFPGASTPLPGNKLGVWGKFHQRFLRYLNWKYSPM